MKGGIGEVRVLRGLGTIFCGLYAYLKLGFFYYTEKLNFFLGSTVFDCSIFVSDGWVFNGGNVGFCFRVVVIMKSGFIYFREFFFFSLWENSENGSEGR